MTLPQTSQLDLCVNERIGKFPALSLETEGALFSYREAGDENAPVIVLLHGIGSSSASWLHQYERLNSQYRIIAWDAPGYGASSPLPMPSPCAIDYANALLAFVKAIGVNKFFLLGHSLGAIIATAFAAHSQSYLYGLILANPARGYAHKSLAEQQTVLDSRLNMLDTLGIEQMAVERSGKLLSNNATKDNISLVQYSMSRLNLDGYKQAINLLVKSDLIAEIGNYEGPCEVFCGSLDNITPPAIAKQVAQHYPQSNYREIPDASHASYIEKPDFFNRALNAFISNNAENGLPSPIDSSPKGEVLTKP